MLEKCIKQLNRVSISVSLGLGLGLVLGLVSGLILGSVPSRDIVLKVPSSHLHVSPAVLLKFLILLQC